jgi:hypothetical protein
VSGIRPPIHSQLADSSRSWSAIASDRAMARPSASRSSAATEISVARTGRSSSAKENFTNGYSSFQRSSFRYDFRNASPIGGAKWTQQIRARPGSRISVIGRS